MGDGGDQAALLEKLGQRAERQIAILQRRVVDTETAYIEDSRVRNGGCSVITGWDGYMDRKASDLVSTGNAGKYRASNDDRIFSRSSVLNDPSKNRCQSSQSMDAPVSPRANEPEGGSSVDAAGTQAGAEAAGVHAQPDTNTSSGRVEDTAVVASSSADPANDEKVGSRRPRRSSRSGGVGSRLARWLAWRKAARKVRAQG